MKSVEEGKNIKIDSEVHRIARINEHIGMINEEIKKK